MSSDPLADLEHLNADTRTIRPGGRTAQVREAVLEGTLAELGEVGYNALRIESIAKRAGVNKTTIYRRWGSKSGLVTTALLETLGGQVPVPDTGDIRSDLIELLLEIREQLKKPWIAGLMKDLTARPSGDDGVYELMERLWPERFRITRVIGERAVERGQLDEATDPDFLLEAACGPLYFRFFMTHEPITPEFIERVVDVLLDGLRP